MMAQNNHQSPVMVVDDLRMNRLVLARIVHKLGFEVLEAENGQQATDLFAREHEQRKRGPAFVFMDIVMPFKDGYETTRELRDLERQWAVERTPIVAYTAERKDNVVDGQTVYNACIMSGMDGCLCKPVTIDRVMEAFREHIPSFRQSLAPRGACSVQYAPSTASNAALQKQVQRMLSEASASHTVAAACSSGRAAPAGAAPALALPATVHPASLPSAQRRASVDVFASSGGGSGGITFGGECYGFGRGGGGGAALLARDRARRASMEESAQLSRQAGALRGASAGGLPSGGGAAAAAAAAAAGLRMQCIQEAGSPPVEAPPCEPATSAGEPPSVHSVGEALGRTSLDDDAPQPRRTVPLREPPPTAPAHLGTTW